MKKEKFIFEIGVEEIPSQYVSTMAQSYLQNAEKAFGANNLSYESAKVYYTPRRLILAVDGLNEKQNDSAVSVKGPTKKIAYNEDGTPSRALLGFLAKNNCTEKDISFVSDAKGDYVVYETVLKGEQTTDVLKKILADVVLSVYNPNPMRWNEYKIKFIRPIRWLLALYGAEKIDVELECAVAGKVTYGHRTLANRAVEVKSADEFFSVLKNNFVIADQAERKQAILAQLKQIEEENGFVVERDDDLLDEISNIVEYPTCAVGHFEEKYLALPACVIKTPMKTQQRYFPVYNKDGKITNAFVFVRNGDKNFIENVIRGNERVLRPRLADAEFFYAGDAKTTLAEKADLLGNVVFVEKAGSYLDKNARVTAIAEKLASKVGFTDTESIKTAVRLMKADLVSNVVREYTEIQGVVGGEFAAADGYGVDVCKAISEQYLPNFAGDKLPSCTLSAIVAIADKLDTIMSLCSVGLKPSSSSDPYGTRRQTLGILLTALDRGFDVDMDKFIEECAPAYEKFFAAEGDTKESFVAFIRAFFAQRLKVFLQEEKGFTVEELSRVSLGDLNIFKAVKKVNLIREIADTDWYKDFMQIFNRVGKLLKSNTADCSDIEKEVVDDEASAMFASYRAVRKDIVAHIDGERYEDAIRLIAEVGKSINDFMEHNFALCEDADKRAQRIRFFADFCSVCGNIISLE